MSNALAIAAVTQSLYNLIQNEFATDPSNDQPTGGVEVTLQAPDAANSETKPNQVNLFLYHVMPNAAWRNMPLPNQVLPGETGQPPLALNLYYMVTVYAREKTGIGDIDGHNLLGRVMRVLYDHPVLGRTDIALPDSGVQDQIERIRITMQPLTIEEIYRLWTGFETPYRLSVSYEVAVVLIESTRAINKPLPVLQIGRDGRGATVVADPFPYPVLFSAQVKNIVMAALPGNLGSANVSGTPPIALQGDTLILQGHLLSGPTVKVVFEPLQSQLPPPLSPDLTSNTDSRIEIVIPQDTTSHWLYGYYKLTVQISQPPLPLPAQAFPPQNTNTLVFALAPEIDTKTPPVAVKNADGTINVTLTSKLQVLAVQKASLLLNDQEIPSDPRSGGTNTLSFTGAIIQQSQTPVTYTLRLRVDGVDSIPFQRPINPPQPWDPYTNPPQFDKNQQVTL